nr:hypothetical protein [uncultured Draconibacterium sp.]
MKKDKIVDYLKYSVGEILLIVLSILFALKINNWNQDRKDENYLHKVYYQMHKDLRSDTLYANYIIDYYEKIIIDLVDIVDRKVSMSYFDTINANNYQNCSKCNCGLITNHLFYNTDKGYKLYREINNAQVDFGKDTLSQYLFLLYEGRITNIKDFGKYLYQLSDEAIKDYQKYDWYSDIIVYDKKYDKEYLKYIYESKEHQQRSARYLYYSVQFVRMLEDYKKRATQTLEILEKKLNK